MKAIFSVIFIVIQSAVLMGQNPAEITGVVIESTTYLPLSNVSVRIENTTYNMYTESKGQFIFKNMAPGKYLLSFALENYKVKQVEIELQMAQSLDLGQIKLEIDLISESKNGGLILLTEDDLHDNDFSIDNTAGVLQASKDVFQRRAAFDFSQAFFRPRGYDSKYARVLINGLPMNRPFNGRPQWSTWGGLNDVLRNQEVTAGLALSNQSFGSLLGVTNLVIRPSLFRPGTRISGSYSNRTYGGRGMITHHSGLKKNGLAYSFSASRRWAQQGFIDGSSYDAFSLFAALESNFGKNSLGLLAFYAPNTRGSTAAITERAYNIFGNTYNPNWGMHKGTIRNARLRTVKEPFVMLNHTYRGQNLSLTTNLSYLAGVRGTSRLDYINAPNPYPNYWRNLNSINKVPQIVWAKLYSANQNILNVQSPGAARYLLYQDRTNDQLFTANTVMNLKIGNRLKLDTGATFSRLSSRNFAIPLDLLGAAYYIDVNPFSTINGAPSRNDITGSKEKGINDPIKYDYSIHANTMNAFMQLQIALKKIDFFLSSSYSSTSYLRHGHFQNETFLANSLGKSAQLRFKDLGFKSGLVYKFSGRHLVSINGTLFSKAPTIRNSFINVRENNNTILNLPSEKITAVEGNYIFRLPKIKGRLSGYYSSIDDATELNFIFAEIGSGTDFFQEVVSQIKKRHLGAELGVEFQASPTTKVTAAAAFGSHIYDRNPNSTVNFDTNEFNGNLISTTGSKDLGAAKIENLQLANGPQQVYSIGLEYRDPKYWWVGVTANYLSHSYADIATVRRTDDFYKNPDDPQGGLFENIDFDLADRLLKQEKFDGFYLLNLIGGKSIRLQRNYLSFFFSINNLFESEFKTGGYEQARTSNYKALVEDTANGNNSRNFGNKYWYGLGRTFFLNIAYSF